MRILGGIVRSHDDVAKAVGGFDDHVHLYVSLKPTHRLSDFVRELKKASTKWIQENHDHLPLSDFHWQEGYGVLTVGMDAHERLKHYILNQAEHHRKKSFADELREIARKLGISVESLGWLNDD